MPEISKEELQDNLDRAQRVQAWLNMPAWTLDVKPALQARRQTNIDQMLQMQFGTTADDQRTIIRFQLSVIVIDEFLAFLKDILVKGEEALEQLNPQVGSIEIPETELLKL